MNKNDLNQAWDLFFNVFRRINKQLPQLTTLALQYVSPKLLACKDLQLAVPGTYRTGTAEVPITHFHPTLTVITSKQRPRRLSIFGSDGQEYQYLLKGHEDLRQDERVMQLFGLVNTLLAADAETFKRQLNIQRYPVIPLSPNSGLIGWVPNCDTLHALIRDYRENRKILLNIEHRMMQQMAPDYEHLPLIHKVEVFQYALDNTTGQDLYRVLWLKSKSAESWLDRRTNYTRSLAVMSMVGYVLGLGDRHPSNLMLDRNTGKVVHIDFGDCFEVAMQRDKYPEKIPFRLTRMLTNAMEVSGIEGSFRITCENVMRVLRENKESVMAVLEAFVHDPLINWRLLTTSAASPPDGATLSTSQTTAAAAAAAAGAPTTTAATAAAMATTTTTTMTTLAAPLYPLSTGSATIGDHSSRHEQSLLGAHVAAAGGGEAAAAIAAAAGNSMEDTAGMAGEKGGASSNRTGMRKAQKNENDLLHLEEELQLNKPEILNARAVTVIHRVNNKLTGRDFKPNVSLDVTGQVQKLIKQATKTENLCQCYIGWCPFVPSFPLCHDLRPLFLTRKETNVNADSQCT